MQSSSTRISQHPGTSPSATGAVPPQTAEQKRPRSGPLRWRWLPPDTTRDAAVLISAQGVRAVADGFISVTVARLPARLIVMDSPWLLLDELEEDVAKR